MTKEGPITPEMTLGSVLKSYPVVRERIKELFGAECMQCHSNERETMIYTSWHKGLDPVKVCSELNALLNK